MGDTISTRSSPEHPSPEQDILAGCIAGRVRLLNRTLTSLYDDLLRPTGLTTAQLNLLVWVATQGPLSPAELALHLNMEKSTLSRNLARLRKQEWVRIDPGTSGPGQLVEIRPLGQERIDEAYPLWLEAQRQAQELLGAKGIQALRTAFDSARARGRSG